MVVNQRLLLAHATGFSDRLVQLLPFSLVKTIGCFSDDFGGVFGVGVGHVYQEVVFGYDGAGD